MKFTTGTGDAVYISLRTGNINPDSIVLELDGNKAITFSAGEQTVFVKEDVLAGLGLDLEVLS